MCQARSAYDAEVDLYGADPDDDVRAKALQTEKVCVAVLCEGVLCYWLMKNATDKAKVKRGVGKELTTIQKEEIKELIHPIVLSRAETASKWGVMTRSKAKELLEQ